MTFVCAECGASYERSPYKAKTTRYCGRRCGAAATFRMHPATHDHLIGNKHAAGRSPNQKGYAPGSIPWNKGTVGVMRPNSGSFRPGQKPLKGYNEGDTVIWIDKQGKPRRFIKRSGKWIPFAQVVWTAEHGPIPHLHIVHHLDRDSLNDSLFNLAAVTRREHLAIHRALGDLE